jgi:cell wall assembly regulator SMI1
MYVKDPGYAPTLSAGATVGITRHVQLDAFVRWTDSDDVKAVFRRHDGTHSGEYTMLTGVFPAEHVVYGTALKAVF